MARNIHTYRAARRAVAKRLYRIHGGSISGHTPTSTFSPAPYVYRKPRKPSKTYSGGNVPGGLRRRLAALAFLEAIPVV